MAKSVAAAVKISGPGMKRYPGWLAGGALALLLSAISPATGAPAAGDAADGGRIYRQYCTPCHGENGDGRGARARKEALRPPPRDHGNGLYMNMQSDALFFSVIRLGGKATGLSHVMPQWGHILSDEQIRDLAAFIRTLARNPPYPGPAMKNWDDSSATKRHGPLTFNGQP